MKKVELHLHLDGSLSLEHASRLLNSPDLRAKMISAGDASLAEYLEKFETPLQLLQTEQNLTNFSCLLAQDLVKDEVIYAEVRFCPLLHLREGLQPHQVIDAVLKGLRSVDDVKTNLILCMARELTEDENRQIIELADEYWRQERGVCGIDLAGDEANHPNRDFQDLFNLTNEKGLPLTIHAGEADGANSVDDALELGAWRVGHGVRATESEVTLKRLVEQQIALEVCPISNLNTGIYPSLDAHPIRRLLDLGVPVTISTDNRTVSDITLAETYELLTKVHGFTAADFLRCNLNAVLSAFLSPAEKVALAKTLIADYANTAKQ